MHQKRESMLRERVTGIILEAKCNFLKGHILIHIALVIVQFNSDAFRWTEVCVGGSFMVLNLYEVLFKKQLKRQVLEPRFEQERLSPLPPATSPQWIYWTKIVMCKNGFQARRLFSPLHFI